MEESRNILKQAGKVYQRFTREKHANNDKLRNRVNYWKQEKNFSHCAALGIAIVHTKEAEIQAAIN